jgi:endogenous inhibitor of DNA gyrase (YacG/DUF329 family)
MSEVVKRARCPICNGEPNSESYPFRPFCSKRCKLLDLARWLSEPPVGMINYIANVRIHGEKIWPFTSTLMFLSLTIGHLLVLERTDKEEATLDAFK